MSEKLSEVFRITAKEWVELEAAAKLLEETKGANFSQLVLNQGSVPVGKAEHQAKASSGWREYLHHMMEARKAANLKWVDVEWIKMRFSEQQSEEATERAERRL
jgi:hypothetical protein